MSIKRPENNILGDTSGPPLDADQLLRDYEESKKALRVALDEQARLAHENSRYRSRYGCLGCGEIHHGDCCPPGECRTRGIAWYSSTQAINRYRAMERLITDLRASLTLERGRTLNLRHLLDRLSCASNKVTTKWLHGRPVDDGSYAALHDYQCAAEELLARTASAPESEPESEPESGSAPAPVGEWSDPYPSSLLREAGSAPASEGTEAAS